MPRLPYIFFSLFLCLQVIGGALPAFGAEGSGGGQLRAVWLGSAAWHPEKYNEQQRVLHAEAAKAFVEHFNLLASLAGGAPWPELELYVAVPEAPGGTALREAARFFTSGAKADLILVTGPEALAALGEARRGAGDAPPPLLALTPDTPLAQLRLLAEESPWPSGDGHDGAALLPATFWRQRLAAYAGATRFRRLGLISPAVTAPLADRALALALRHEAESLAAKGDFEVFAYDDLAGGSPEQCREAVDYLFFDEIDALVLDGYGCFAPERSDYAELMDLLRQRGIFPLSVYDSSLAASGAMLAPAPGEGGRLGRALAAQFFAALSPEPVHTPRPTAGRASGQTSGLRSPQNSGALFRAATARLGGRFAPGLPFFSVNLITAGSMGFDPPAALMAISREASASEP